MSYRSFYLKMATVGDPFSASETDCILEVASILRDTADRLEAQASSAGALFAADGKLCGQYEFSEQPLARFAMYEPE